MWVVHLHLMELLLSIWVPICLIFVPFSLSVLLVFFLAFLLDWLGTAFHFSWLLLYMTYSVSTQWGLLYKLLTYSPSRLLAFSYLYSFHLCSFTFCVKSIRGWLQSDSKSSPFPTDAPYKMNLVLLPSRGKEFLCLLSLGLACGLLWSMGC